MPTHAIGCARPSVAPTSRIGTSGISNRPASGNGQTRRTAIVMNAISPAGRRRGLRSDLVHPQTITPDAAAAQRLTRTARAGDRRNTVPTSTKGPVI